MTKERLRAYRDRKKELLQIGQMIETLEARLYAPKAQRLTGMPSGPATGRNAAEDMADQHLELLAHYKDMESTLKAEQLAVEHAIASLEPIQRTLLRHYYIEGMKWEEVCVKVGYSWRQTHNIHAKALKMLRDIEEGQG